SAGVGVFIRLSGFLVGTNELSAAVRQHDVAIVAATLERETDMIWFLRKDGYGSEQDADYDQRLEAQIHRCLHVANLRYLVCSAGARRRGGPPYSTMAGATFTAWEPGELGLRHTL